MSAQPSLKRRFQASATLLAGAGLLGCLTLQEDSPTELYIVLFWEDGSDGNRIEDETCETAGVDRVTWTLIRTTRDGRSETKAESETDELCSNELPFAEVPPGEYTLEIRGDDGQGTMEWAGTCDGLYVDRFSEEYPCRVFLVDESDGPSNPDPSPRDDGGMPDGGQADAG